MHAHGMSRLLAAGLAASWLLAPRPAEAQAPPPVVGNEAPARFVLSSGSVVVGTKVGEDPEFYLVQTAAGIVRVRKSDVASIDFRVGAAPEPPPPGEQEANDEDDDGRRRGMSTFSASLYGFGLVYGLTALTGAFVAIADPDANWLLVPVAGPILYYQQGDLAEGTLGIMILLTIFQGGTALGMLVGAILAASKSDDTAGGGPQIAAGLEVLPEPAPGVTGLRLSFEP